MNKNTPSSEKPARTVLDAARANECAALLAQHEAGLRAYLYRQFGGQFSRRGGMLTVEDLVQNTLLKAWKNFGTWSGENFYAWLLRIAQRTALNALRSQGRRAAHTAAWSVDPASRALFGNESPCPEATALWADARQKVQAALPALPPKQQQAFRLGSEGKTAVEMAPVLGCEKRQAQRYLQAAKKSLHEHLR